MWKTNSGLFLQTYFPLSLPRIREEHYIEKRLESKMAEEQEKLVSSGPTNSTRQPSNHSEHLKTQLRIEQLQLYKQQIYHFSAGRTRQINSLQKREHEAVMTARHLIIMDISKMLELEFRITIIKILVGLEKKHRLENLFLENESTKSNQVKI